MSGVLTYDEAKNILTRVLEVTRLGRITWEKISISQYGFQATLPRHELEIYATDRDDLPPYEFIINDKDTFSPTQLASIKTAVSNDAVVLPSEPNAMLADLYFLAKRQGLNIPSAVTDLLADIDSLTSFGGSSDGAEPPF